MQLYLSAGFSLPAQATYFLICVGDSIGAGITPKPDHVRNISQPGAAIRLWCKETLRFIWQKED